MDIKLKNVRLSFPNLFKPKAFEGSEPAFSASFLLDKRKHAAQIEEIKSAIAKLVKEELKGKTPKGTCLHDGSEKPDTDGYGDDMMYVSARSKKRPAIVDRDKSQLGEDDGKPYGGCYVNAIVRLWAQDNNYGKRINASLRAVQFAADGEPFGEAPVNTDEAFDDLDDSEEL